MSTNDATRHGCLAVYGALDAVAIVFALVSGGAAAGGQDASVAIASRSACVPAARGRVSMCGTVCGGENRRASSAIRP